MVPVPPVPPGSGGPALRRGAEVERTWLDEGSWVDVVRGWMDGADALYETAVSTSDAAARTQAYQEMQRTLHAEGGYLMWGFADWIVGAKRGVGGISTAPANTFDWARFDKVWMG